MLNFYFFLAFAGGLPLELGSDRSFCKCAGPLSDKGKNRQPCALGASSIAGCECSNLRKVFNILA